jgi:RNA polymerase sigma-70 factor, ECF subfamily
MLRSPDDAEDAVQDTLLRAWRGLPQFEGRSSVRTWLYRIAINTSHDAIRRRGLLEPASPEAHTVEDVVEEDPAHAPADRYERQETVEEAFIAALRLLPARQRAALILREVFGFTARETAERCNTTVAAVNSALQRARATIEERPRESCRRDTVRSLGDDGTREIVARYVEAWKRDDIDAIVSLLADESSSRDP